MTEATPLDAAYAAMTAAPEDAETRLDYYFELGASLLFVLLEEGAAGDQRLTPRSFAVDGADYVLAFDREDRLAEFAAGPAPLAEMPGRDLVALLAAEGGAGLAINLGAASGNLLPPEVVAWLAETLRAAPERAEARIAEVLAPRGLPERLIAALDRALARAAGLADCAVLAGVRYDDGGRGHLLIVAAARDGAEAAMARAVSEALVFSGIEAGALDVLFVKADADLLARASRVGLRFDLPVGDGAAPAVPRAAPGSNPNKPPILR
jgi:hypothetical protein